MVFAMAVCVSHSWFDKDIDYVGKFRNRKLKSYLPSLLKTNAISSLIELPYEIIEELRPGNITRRNENHRSSMRRKGD